MADSFEFVFTMVRPVHLKIDKIMAHDKPGWDMAEIKGSGSRGD